YVAGRRDDEDTKREQHQPAVGIPEGVHLCGDSLQIKARNAARRLEPHGCDRCRRAVCRIMTDHRRPPPTRALARPARCDRPSCSWGEDSFLTATSLPDTAARSMTSWPIAASFSTVNAATPPVVWCSRRRPCTSKSTYVSVGHRQCACERAAV